MKLDMAQVGNVEQQSESFSGGQVKGVTRFKERKKPAARMIETPGRRASSNSPRAICRPGSRKNQGKGAGTYMAAVRRALRKNSAATLYGRGVGERVGSKVRQRSGQERRLRILQHRRATREKTSASKIQNKNLIPQKNSLWGLGG